MSVRPGVVEPPGRQSGPPGRPAGLCTVPGLDPFLRVLDWPGNRCELLLLPFQAASTKGRQRSQTENTNKLRMYFSLETVFAKERHVPQTSPLTQRQYFNVCPSSSLNSTLSVSDTTNCPVHQINQNL